MSRQKIKRDGPPPQRQITEDTPILRVQTLIDEAHDRLAGAYHAGLATLNLMARSDEEPKSVDERADLWMRIARLEGELAARMNEVEHRLLTTFGVQSGAMAIDAVTPHWADDQPAVTSPRALATERQADADDADDCEPDEESTEARAELEKMRAEMRK